MKTSELTGPALDLIVDRLEGGCAPTNPDHLRIYLESLNEDELWNELCKYTPGGIYADTMSTGDMIEYGIATWRWPPVSTDWAQGGPIIERERITIEWEGDPDSWCACIMADQEVYGPTALIAAMRCYVASKMGDTIDIPEELI
jgi:hypothetical protein